MLRNLEQLCKRRLLSGEPFAVLADNTLTVTGTPTADQIVVDTDGSAVRATRNGVDQRVQVPSTLQGEGGNNQHTTGSAAGSLDVADATSNARLLADEPFAVLESNTLTVWGTPEGDDISVGAEKAVAWARRNNEVLFFPVDQIFRIVIHGGEGDDVLGNSIPFPATLIGGAGDDQLSDGPSNDLLDCGTGDDTVSGGSLSDSVGDNIIVGGGGRDVVWYHRLDQGSLSSWRIWEDAQTAELRILTPELCIDRIVDPRGITLRLTAGPDAVDFSARISMVLDTSGGIDRVELWSDGRGSIPTSLPTIMAGDGNDTVRFNRDATVAAVDGGAGDDQIFARNGHLDTIDGGPGRDFAQVDGGRGGDVVINIEKLDARPVRMLDFRFVFAERRLAEEVLW